MQIFKVSQYSPTGASVTPSLRCPVCKQRASLHPLPNTQDIVLPFENAQVVAAYRRCPNPDCLSLLFVVTDPASKLLVSYPPERLDFDTTNVPAAVTNAITEAVTCHAHECYIAAAIMVRKTLEELCRDRGATGASLKDRLRNLGSKVVLPQELLDGLDDLRLLGNDAAHIESQEFNKVGKDEVEIGIELAKEVLKAVYQYSSLLSRLRALRKP
jgi:HEPN domain-containing protein